MSWKDKKFADKVKIAVIANQETSEQIKKQLKNKRIQDRPVEVIGSTNAGEDVLGVDFIFVSDSKAVFENITPSKTKAMVFSSSQDHLKQATISFMIKNGSLRFGINIEDAQQRGIIIDPKVIKLAAQIID